MLNLQRTCAFVAAALITFVSIAVGESLSVMNPGFEEPALSDGAFTHRLLPDHPVPGWSVIDADGLIDKPNYGTDFGVFNPPAGAFPDEASEGNNVAFIWMAGPFDTGELTLSQTLTDVLAANTTYTLQVDVGDQLEYANFQMEGFPGYRIELLAGDTVLATDLDSLSIEEGSFQTTTLTYTSPSDAPNLGSSLEIRLTNLLQGPGFEVDFDNVRLDASSAGMDTQGDLNGDGVLSVLDLAIVRTAAANQSEDPAIDLNQDGVIDQSDASYWVKNIAHTWIGDVDLDGEFNSADLVSVFRANEYEDGIPLNSTWPTGDWNGDQEFNSTDLVAAFEDGGYESGPRMIAAAVPEPSVIGLLFVAVAFLAGRFRYAK